MFWGGLLLRVLLAFHRTVVVSFRNAVGNLQVYQPSTVLKAARAHTARAQIDALGRSGAVLIVLIAGSSGMQAETAIRSGARITLDIPSQPLADAIYAYTAATGVEALAAGNLLADRRSAEVRGTLTPEEALQTLLVGTGLTARFMDPGSFTLAPMQAVPAAAQVADTPSQVPRYASYSVMVQNAVKRALCQQPSTRPGYYRTAIQIWIGPSGSVARSTLVGTTGDVARDKALTDAFRTLSVGAPPPAGLPQPATILILPRAQASDCGSVERTGEP